MAHMPEVENFTIASLYARALAKDPSHDALTATRPVRRIRPRGVRLHYNDRVLTSVTLRNLAIAPILHLHNKRAVPQQFP